MKKLLVVLAVLLFVSPVFGEPMILTLEGPADPLPPGPGKFKVDVFGQNTTDFAGIETVLEFLEQPGDILSDDFQISKTAGNPDFAELAIWPNEAKFPSPFPLYISDPGHPLHRQKAGFMLWAGAELTEKTLLQSVWYDYTADAFGIYAIGADLEETVLSDSLALPIDYRVAPDSIVTIVPEPTSIALLGAGLLGLFGFFIYSRKKIPKG